jgi:pilus assembly protein CpaB
MNTRRITLLLAILLAIGTGWLTLNYINNVRNTTLANNAPRQVVVAAIDIPARTPITPNMIRQTTLPSSVVERDAIDTTEAADGQLSLITIPAGSQITSSKVGRPSDVGLPVRLSPGKRAISIQIDRVKGISGLLEPGDRVDVLAIPPRNGNGSQLPQTAAILRGIKVLAVGNSMETTSATPSPDYQNSTTVTLEVTPKQADLLASADANTTLRLALRSPREPLNSEPTESLQLPITQVAAAPAPQPAPAAAPAAPAPQPVKADPQHGSIMIIDGDRIGWSTSGGNQ